MVTKDGDTPGRVHRFRQSPVHRKPMASPSRLCITPVADACMALTRPSGDAVLVGVRVGMTRRDRGPPGIFASEDGIGLVARRLERIPDVEPAVPRIISDTKRCPVSSRLPSEPFPRRAADTPTVAFITGSAADPVPGDAGFALVLSRRLCIQVGPSGTGPADRP